MNLVLTTSTRHPATATPAQAAPAEAPAPQHGPADPAPSTAVSLASLIQTAADQHRRQVEQAAAHAAARALQARNAHD